MKIALSCQNMKYIKLENETTVVIVDDKNFERLSKFTWCRIGSKRNFSVARNIYRGRKDIIRISLANEIMNTNNILYDHIDRNPLNNQEENLRKCDHSQNSCNREKVWWGTSKHKGISWWKKAKRWESRITYRGKTYRLGLFESEEKAALAYNEAAIRLHGEFAVLNKVQQIIDKTKDVKDDESTMIEEDESEDEE